MRPFLVILAGVAGLAMSGPSALASDCAQMRANLSAAVSDVLTAASADPIELADLTAKVNGADAALKALTDTCGEQAKTATMPAATAVMGPAGSAERSGETQRPSPSEMMARTGRTHVTIGNTPETRGASAAVVSQQAASLVADLRAAIAADDLAGIRKIAGDSAN